MTKVRVASSYEILENLSDILIYPFNSELLSITNSSFFTKKLRRLFHLFISGNIAL